MPDSEASEPSFIKFQFWFYEPEKQTISNKPKQSGK